MVWKKTAQSRLEKHAGIYFYKSGTNAKTQPIIIIPGGPWISGQYLDKFSTALAGLKNTTTYRAVLPNHEVDFGASPNIKFIDIVKLMAESIKEISSQHTHIPILIGHSLGSLILSYAIQNYPLNLRGMILISSPLTLTGWPKFEEKLKQKNISTGTEIEDENSFANWWHKAAPLYFANNAPLKPETATLLTGQTFMSGSESQPYSTTDLRHIYRGLYKYVDANSINLMLIEGDQDPIRPVDNLAELKEIFTSRVNAIRESGHFPMIENQIATQDLVECFIKSL